jgi:hypothetical protein
MGYVLEDLRKNSSLAQENPYQAELNDFTYERLTSKYLGRATIIRGNMHNFRRSRALWQIDHFHFNPTLRRASIMR